MSNVVPFRRPAPVRTDCDVLSVADDLIEALARVESLGERAALMARPAAEIDRIVRNLADAALALEHALDSFGEGSEAAPV